MNLTMIVARKGEKFSSLGIGTDSRGLKDKFKGIDEKAGFDAVYLIDSRTGQTRKKVFARSTVRARKRPAPEPAPETETAPEETLETDGPDFEAAPDILAGIE
jgi:hypothetical protein